MMNGRKKMLSAEATTGNWNFWMGRGGNASVTCLSYPFFCKCEHKLQTLFKSYVGHLPLLTACLERRSVLHKLVNTQKR